MPVQRTRETLRSQNPQNADCVADPHILFIHPVVNSLSCVQMLDTHLRRLGRSTACVFLPAFQIPTEVQILTLCSSARGSLMGLPVGLLPWPLGHSTSNRMETWKTGRRSVTQGETPQQLPGFVVCHIPILCK